MLDGPTRGAEALGLDQRWLVAELHERLSYCFDQRRWAADEHAWLFAWRPGDFLEHRAIDAASEAGPSRRLVARQRMPDLECSVTICQTGELVPIDHLVPSARRVQ